jgi:hypothetical protein
MTSILPAVFVYRFSGIGEVGLHQTARTRELADQAKIVLGIVFGLFVIGYSFDVHFWHPDNFAAKLLTFIMVVATTGALLVMSGSGIPFMPVCIFTLLVPLFLLMLKYVFFRSVPAHTFAKQSAGVIILLGVLLMAVFILWFLVFDGVGWNDDTRIFYSHLAGCLPDFKELDYCRHEGTENPCFFKDDTHPHPVFTRDCPHGCAKVYDSCGVAFIIWINPALAAMALIVIGFMVDYARAREPFNHRIKLVVEATCGFLFVFWIFASSNGAGGSFTTSLIAYAIAMTVGSVIIMWAIILSDEVAEHNTEAMLEEALENTESFVDIIKGCVILFASPLLLFYMLLSMFRQIIRKMRACFCCTNLEYRGLLTERAAEQFDDFRYKWKHCNVLTYAFYIGLVYVVFSIFPKLTNVFLSWLIQVTSTMDMLPVTGIVTGVGMVLFMLPPVPGLPIYLTSGIVLVAIGKDRIGLEQSIAYAMFVSTMIKLLACAIQQKIIGGLLGSSTSVKQMVGINSDALRTMRLILEEPGLSFNKIAVLVGGPDWPVSVLCGILGLDLLPILIGTLPVIVVVAPTVLSGSYTFMASVVNDDESLRYPWADTWGTIVTSVLGGIMLINTLAAANAVAVTVKNRKAEIDALPYDEEVKKADEEIKKIAVFRKKVVVWKNVPVFFKMCLILSVMSMIASVYALTFGKFIFGEESFQDFNIMDTIDDHLGGNWLNIFKPMGRIALLICFVSFLFFQMFKMWANSATNKAIAESKSGESDALLGKKKDLYV